MFGKKKVDTPVTPATSAAPVAPVDVPAKPVKAQKAKKPAGPSTPLTFGDIAVISSCVLLIVALVFEMLGLKALQLF